MVKWLKFSALALISVFLLLIIATIILANTLNANQFKPQIQSIVEKKIGRQLSLNGNIELSLYPWTGFSAAKLSLNNAKGVAGKPFVELEQGSIKINLLSLLSNKIEVQQIQLIGLTINLTKNKDGRNNWDDLFNTKKTEQTSDLSIGSISIEKAKISWDDQQQDIYTEINDFNFKTAQLEFNQPTQLTSSFTLINKEPAITEKIHFSSSLVLNKTLDKFKLTGLTLDSVTHSKEITPSPLKLTLVADLALDLKKQTLDISRLDVNLKNLLISAKINVTDIIDAPLAKGSIKIFHVNMAQFLKNMGISLPNMQNPKALSSFSTTLSIQTSKEATDIKSITIILDDSTIKGFACIKHPPLSISHFNLTVDTINMDHYLPEEKLKPVKSDNQITTHSLKTATKSLTESTALLPLEELKKINVYGVLTINKLDIRELSMQDLKLKLKTKDNTIKTPCE